MRKGARRSKSLEGCRGFRCKFILCVCVYFICFELPGFAQDPHFCEQVGRDPPLMRRQGYVLDSRWALTSRCTPLPRVRPDGDGQRDGSFDGMNERPL
jgi:hypothetical protein